ncbi:phosphoribosylglycinamide formyltransferase 2 [Pseudoalteromonas sp. MSK9-3]|uniref:formate-dependent phosphoribosylglycinamide formyltransferase n=1 Tax=Pseudoalteromonas sp. MSK9-3 TaxID=1897633 RepID=UPI000E6C4D05|nr:formate-dependent phosphoribosylglycinamide formyltransferase [Pseudoalteromonas sp. MSK9-3]RJE76143.1 phosphoribosylglycinamide formyltransferase 2 [Pseudoalteromonas sp. MSK9-3]
MKIKKLGTPFSATACKVMLCGGGELGKEVVIEFKRLGCEVIVLDRYEHAPAMQVADRSYVLSMLDGEQLEKIIQLEQPDYIVPEIEAIATDKLVALEEQGFTVVPSAKATQLTMNREGIRRLAAEELNILTSEYQFVDTFDDFQRAIEAIGFPCVVKPIMSSSGKGQSVVKHAQDIAQAWQYAQEGGRAGQGRVIVEGFVDFDYEITLLTVRHVEGTSFCEPIGHVQKSGDYQQSWQPQAMSKLALERSKEVATLVTDTLGGRGLFGVELFVKGDEVFFSEVSPRPHDTGMVTLISQDLSEFALHVRAILGLPIPNISFYGPSASSVILVTGESSQVIFGNVAHGLSLANTDIRLFGKPEVQGTRRMGVALARDTDVQLAVDKAKEVVSRLEVTI